ncbi:MAG: YkgJ family cysteine cluster protein [Parachlamydiales bacterium]|nr:YkgJ family cysteine cluster protein [Parachlamydiales bacterium]
MNDWYKKGLYFKCHKCSKCCTGGPGYVWLCEIEIEKISKHLNLSKNDFLKKYTRCVRGKISLIENQKNFDCVFLKDKKCQIYEVRPSQCKTFPFWHCNLSSEKNWEDLKESCPGIDDKNGQFFDFEKIREIVDPNL